ncbi:MAG: DNA topoisomerase IV subunit A [Polyangiales bacterium]
MAIDERDRKTLKKIEQLAYDALAAVRIGKNPSLEIPVRALSNVNFDKDERVIRMGESRQSRAFFHFKQAKNYMQTFLIAERCKKLIEAGATTSIRDIYYDAKHSIAGSKENTFEEQAESDPIIEDLEVTIDALREELHLRAENKGAMVGPMTVRDTGDDIDLRRMGSGGWSVPSIVEDNRIQFRGHEAEFVLFVEKGAVWSRLNEDRFWQRHKCMLIHGGGMAARGTRRLLRRMHEELKLPVYVLTDNDPWGFYIYSVIKQGSINLAYESMRMAVPKARFLGLSSFDADRFNLKANVSMALTDEDDKRADQLLKYEWFADKRWQDELARMKKTEKKYELEALSSLGIRFITEEYIPHKIKNRLWLD